MSDHYQDLSKKFINLLDNKQFHKLQLEIEKMGDIKEQHPLVIFYYACSIYLQIPVNNSEKKNNALLFASELFEIVYKYNTKNLQPIYNMMAISFKTKVFKNVLPLALMAYENNNSDTQLIEGLARINFYIGNVEVSVNLFKTLYKHLPEKIEWRDQYVSSLNYVSNITQQEYLKECLNFNFLLEKNFLPKNDYYQFNSKRNKKIKISFLSGNFKTHSISHFLLGLLEKIDQSIFEIHMVSNLKISNQDETSEEFKKLVFKWHDVDQYSDDYLVDFLRSLNLDILIDLDGFTSGNRLVVLARRCAKVQIEWLGYNNSLGIKNLDYLISDKNLIKSEELNLYSETILFLPKIWNAFSLPKKLPSIKDKNLTNDDNFMYCSFNNFLKLTDKTIEVWSKILLKTNSGILLKDSSVGNEDLKNNILNKFYKNGVKKNQITIIDRQKNIDDHLQVYNLANLALDTFPYTGVTTSFEAIMMGVPVLTMKGFNFNSRCGESININLGMASLIAIDDDDYVKKAIYFKENKNLNTNFGIKLREKAITSPLFDTKTFSKDFQNLLIKIYKQN